MRQIFMGMGDRSVVECCKLETLLRETFSLISAVQQPCHCECVGDEPCDCDRQRDADNEKIMENAAHIFESLTGEVILSTGEPYPHERTR